MNYQNPIIRGFYPDPSVCFANGKYYLVCSSMQYFPGVPLFESEDLVNWTQIGHCLTRPDQIALQGVSSSGGVFAPSIRYFEGRFYMTTTNSTTQQNFFVWTDDIYGEWSDHIFIDQDGIDPSLFFENGKSYFMSNGSDAEGISGIVQCEIAIDTGKKLSPSKTIWQGSGGRYLEGPHLYKIKDYYYLVAAEGGTEYGHMVTYARSTSPYGPFEAYPSNPVLTNRNLGGFQIQGVGHGDLIEAPDGSFWMLHLGFRQTGRWTTFHHLGREVFLSPVSFHDDGWFTVGTDGTTSEYVEVPFTYKVQEFKTEYTFCNTDFEKDWCYQRHPSRENYSLSQSQIILNGNSISLDDVDSPTFIGLRQKEFCCRINCDIEIDRGEAGITFYMDENHHYDLAISKYPEGFRVIVRLCIGNIKSIEAEYSLGDSNRASFIIDSNSQQYSFYVKSENEIIHLGTGLTRYLSSEVAGGFTGVIIGLYALDHNSINTAKFKDFKCEYLHE
ncbi:glycoside hydrolase family 43 protein [Lachnoclostridium phytofermentans]|uniref:Glycoside hydrolase family 43 n=1 Tax=Lachnoclostridium phytofermentans (strain ATCC 700394 / DSM 18823 / ISDg) TaxID=357809 RepID=A9KIE4_LACP7|nr:glycoside hydrolase family 43 protein [Lachnoclostridium phytofermentans]ABX42396.1 glycoside hydrolase family 43 [Lachnoclostridium phytofermentans ISDg]